jgi:pimeloyl-ACP methyl ester carboxylesterase
MNDEEVHTFVLVAGGWCGSWAWRDVISGLRKRGHNVSAPTLAGLGERSHVANGSADLSMHIEDIIAHLEMEDLRNVTLVGWSYGGMVTTGVLSHAWERIKSMIYLDAFVPENGKSWIDYSNAQWRETLESYKRQDMSIPPPPLEYFKVTEPSIVNFIKPRLRNQPWRTLFEPVDLSQPIPEIPKCYVRCRRHEQAALTDAFERTKLAGARTLVIDADHFCPMTAVEATIDVLIDLA